MYVGTVKILSDRAYGNLMVTPGIYPVGKDNKGYYFELSGYPITPMGTTERLDEESSLFKIYTHDTLDEDNLKPQSIRLYIEDFRGLLDSSLCTPGPEQRLVIQLTEGVI